MESNEQIIIQELLSSLAQHQPSYGHSRLETIFDTTHNHYQLILSGWEDSKRIYGIVAHIVIRGDLIWLEEDMTEASLAEKLVERGIPRERIVLGFQAPYKRGLYGFASGEGTTAA
jgi:XisI protein